MKDYNDFLAERRAKQFGTEVPKALSPEEATDSVVVEKKKSTEKTKRKDDDE